MESGCSSRCRANALVMRMKGVLALQLERRCCRAPLLQGAADAAGEAAVGHIVDTLMMSRWMLFFFHVC